ncbi:MAG: hypothetical protein H6810_06710 [Phycisphaeraceae bacterium]|nr:MAG: hypothetical protein H6810_06710 [Phycisphaeraceae bacterium]
MHDDPAHPATTRSVLLEHATSDGGMHLDWLIERPGTDAEHRLITFRCEHDPTDCAEWMGERLADHRAVYLDFEGPISGGRGTVHRIWSKACRVLIATADRIVVQMDGPMPATFVLIRREGARWTIGPPS